MIGHWLFLKLIFLLGTGHSAEHCDRGSTVQDHEGNLGQTQDYNWLGVLHVPLDPEWIATTGIVLIKTKHALAIADDVARIPQHVFKSHSRAMFLASRDTPWFVKLASYITHPEYEYSALNSIAVIELDLDDVEVFPLTPVCLARVKIFSASRYTYLAGFTHENQKLEKVFYKIQHLNDQVCKDSYNMTDTTELSSQKPIPSAHLCGYAPNSALQCVWDNGMSLVSNDFGYLNLIGFGVHGPGCAATAHFIDLFPYFHWINFITGSVDYRRKDAVVSINNEFIPKSKRKKVAQNFPIHDLFTKGELRRTAAVVHRFEAYPFDIDKMKFHLVQPTIDKNTYLIFPFKEQWARNETSCTLPTVVIYEETFQVTAVDDLQGSATYKLSLYDSLNSECICVRLTVNCDSRSDAILSFKEEIDFKEDTFQDKTLGERTPDEVLINFPFPKREKGGKTELFVPQFITDDVLSKKILNYDLYITFKFTEHAELKFEMLAEKPKPTTSTTTTTTEPPETTEPPTEATEPPKKGPKRMRIMPMEVMPSASPEQPFSSDYDLLQEGAETKKQKKPNPQEIRERNRMDTGIYGGDEEIVTARVEEVFETRSVVRGEVARGKGAPGAGAGAGWLLAAALRIVL
ncbi:hypothetical protein PYW08_009928 [Mythimna loreyi]|uniref:Uncharacterized protein n=1 Tax=Mythimna loreyi TaxID=667449 RepID=A0ACC2Q6T1_9NEOP|nr:hypothetical protein PYW08_009928 [Mythimna loreyi]